MAYCFPAEIHTCGRFSFRTKVTGSLAIRKGPDQEFLGDRWQTDLSGDPVPSSYDGVTRVSCRPIMALNRS
jgi:hypothetical protein